MLYNLINFDFNLIQLKQFSANMLKSLLVIGRINIFDDVVNDEPYNQDTCKYLDEEEEVDNTNLFKIPKYLETVSIIKIIWI